MAYVEHITTKPEKIAATAVGLLYEDLLLPNLFTAASFDDYKGAKDGVVNVKVPGLLPARVYKFRNDRSEPIKYDTYTEDTVQVAFNADRPYSAVELTDEQVDFDEITVNTLMPKQAHAVGRAMELNASYMLDNAQYEVTIGGAEANLYQTLIEARKILNKFRAQGTRYLVVGTDFEAALLLDPRFTTAVSVGNEAGAVMRSGNIGNWAGFTIFTSPLIEPGTAYAFTDASFATATAAPYIPNSVPFGATATYSGYGLRWIRDYDAQYLVDRSVVDAYFGSTQVLDRGFVIVDRPAIEGKLNDTGTANNAKVLVEKILDGQFNVRSLKITLGGTSALGTSAESKALTSALGITKPVIKAPAQPAPAGTPAP